MFRLGRFASLCHQSGEVGRNPELQQLGASFTSNGHCSSKLLDRDLRVIFRNHACQPAAQAIQLRLPVNLNFALHQTRGFGQHTASVRRKPLVEVCLCDAAEDLRYDHLGVILVSPDFEFLLRILGGFDSGLAVTIDRNMRQTEFFPEVQAVSLRILKQFGSVAMCGLRIPDDAG